MKFKLAVLLATTLWTGVAVAGLEEAQKAYEAEDYETAQTELLPLAESGNPVANYMMGQIYQKGLGVDVDEAAAIKFYEVADQGYNTKASVALAKMVMAGQGTTENKDLGIEYLKKAAYIGSADALFELGEVYQKGDGVEKNDVYAFGFYYMSALKGDKRAQLKVARCYLAGRGIPQDYDAASKWFMRSANQGFLPAQMEWADLRAGHPRLRNPLDAYSWYTIIAAYANDSNRDTAAQRRDAIGKKFERQVITAQQKKIKEWRPVQAKYSVPKSEVQSAILPIIPGYNDDETVKARLETGASLDVDGTIYGIMPDMIKEAAKTGDKGSLEKAVQVAADDGKVKVYGYYGDMLRNHFKDEAEAVKWYQKGSDAGEAYATYQLGKSYCEGRGIEPNIGNCYGLLLMANQHPDKTLALTLKNALEAVEASATDEEKAEGKAFMEKKAQTQEESKKSRKKAGTFNLF